MRAINIDIDDEFKEIAIVPISDVHLGSPQCNEKLLHETIAMILSKPNYYTVINGDFVDMALKNSKSDVYSSTMTPMQTLSECCRILKPLADANRILVITDGNHEQRMAREVGINPMYIVACQLGIENRYASGMWYLFLKFGHRSCDNHRLMYNICGYHGSGGGRKLGGKINRVNELHEIVIADLYIMGHTHTPLANKSIMFMPNNSNAHLEKREMHYLISNAFLNYEDSYAESMALLPSSNGITMAILNGNKKKINIVI